MAIPDSGGSAAYKAGQAHGTALATHHATSNGAVKAKQAASAAPFTLQSLTRQAQSLSAADVNAQVAAIRAQQDQINKAATLHAAQINAASRAAAGMLGDIGDQTASSYSQAAKDLAALAQGYSGQLQTTATDAADQISKGLAAIGAPTSTVPAGEQTQNLGNLLYGLGGALPASTLLTAGQAQAGAQRQLPASTLGYGQQQAQGALAAGQTAAQGLTNDILQARAGQGAGTRNYLSQLISAANAQAQAAQDAALLPYLIQQKQSEAAAAGAPKTITSGGAVYQQDPTTGQITQVYAPPPKPKSPAPPKTVAPGSSLVDPNTGKVIYTAPPKPSSKPKGKTLSAKDLQKATAAINFGVNNMFNGFDPKTGKKSPDFPPLDRNGAIVGLTEKGYFSTDQLAKIAMAAINRKYGKPVKIGPTGSFGFQAAG